MGGIRYWANCLPEPREPFKRDTYRDTIYQYLWISKYSEITRQTNKTYNFLEEIPSGCRRHDDKTDAQKDNDFGIHFNVIF